MRLIDADELKKKKKHSNEFAENVVSVAEIDWQPTVDAEPVGNGTWRHYERMLTCSECGTMFYDDIMEYCGDDVPRHCPECGAKMDGEQEKQNEKAEI